MRELETGYNWDLVHAKDFFDSAKVEGSSQLCERCLYGRIFASMPSSKLPTSLSVAGEVSKLWQAINGLRKAEAVTESAQRQGVDEIDLHQTLDFFMFSKFGNGT